MQVLDEYDLLCGAGCWIVLENERGLGSRRAATPSCPEVLDASGSLDLLALLCGAGCWFIVGLPLLFFEGEVSAPPRRLCLVLDEDNLLELLCGVGCWIVLDEEDGLWSCCAALPSCPQVLDENDLLALLCGV